MTRRTRKDLNQFTFHFHQDDSLISRPVEGGSQEVLSDFDMHLRSSIKTALDGCTKREKDPLDRYEIAARMSRKLGREITKSHIDQWVAMSTVQRRIHVDSLKALCEVIGDMSPIHSFVESCGLKALHPDEAAAAEYGAKMLFKRMIDNDLKEILNDLDNPTLRKQLIARAIGGGE